MAPRTLSPASGESREGLPVYLFHFRVFIDRKDDGAVEEVKSLSQ